MLEYMRRRIRGLSLGKVECDICIILREGVDKKKMQTSLSEFGFSVDKKIWGEKTGWLIEVLKTGITNREFRRVHAEKWGKEMNVYNYGHVLKRLGLYLIREGNVYRVAEEPGGDDKKVGVALEVLRSYKDGITGEEFKKIMKQKIGEEVSIYGFVYYLRKKGYRIERYKEKGKKSVWKLIE